MNKEHHYACEVLWTGNSGEGTKTYAGYSRDHEVIINGKVVIEGSADTAFLGDPSRHNPEDLLLAALSACHMLWYLHLCADQGIVVTGYRDHAAGTMLQTGAGGHFTSVVLHPQVTITDMNRVEEANALHTRANQCCFIAGSCNFPVTHEPLCLVES